MAQREVTDQENTKWVCVQAYTGGGNSEMLEKVKELSGDGKVDVVCTPTGGAQSVRIKLAEDWEQLPDEELLKEIEASAK